jgi:hypothetical protein
VSWSHTVELLRQNSLQDVEASHHALAAPVLFRTLVCLISRFLGTGWRGDMIIRSEARGGDGGGCWGRRSQIDGCGVRAGHIVILP